MSRVSIFLAFLTIVGIAGYLLNLAALHFLRTDVNPMVEPVSNYAVGAYGFLAAVILLSWNMGKDEQWRFIRRPALALALVVLGMAVLTIVGANIGIGFGVAQRLFNVTSMGWMLLVALCLRSIAQGALPGQPSRVR